MTAQTEDRTIARKGGDLFAATIAATEEIFKGALVSLDSTGYVKPAADAAAERLLGVSETNYDNTSGADGAADIEGRRNPVFEFVCAGMTLADLGADVYVVDDQTVGLGVVAQPVNVTGAVVERIATSLGGTLALAFTFSGTTLGWGGGTAVDISGGGEFILTAVNGSQIKVTVTAGSIPGSDKSDNIQLRYVRAGVIEKVVSATSVFVDITSACN